MEPKNLSVAIVCLALAGLISCGGDGKTTSSDENDSDAQPGRDTSGNDQGTDNHANNNANNNNANNDNGSTGPIDDVDVDKERVWNEGLNPGVNRGIADLYPDDVGIADHPAVYAAEDFETGAVALSTEEERLRDNLTIVTDEVYTGQYASSFSWPQDFNGPTTRFLLSTDPADNPYDAYFVRACYNFDASFHPQDQDRGVGVKGFGVYAEGPDTTDDNWYNASLQFVGWGGSSKPEANDGYLWVGHLYSYNPHPEEAVAEVGDIENLSEDRFSAYASTFDYIRFNTWRCYEVGLYLNTPGKNDGEARFWIDGVLQSRTTHMRFRDAEKPRPDNVNINLHRVTEDFAHTMTRWMDNIVISRRYIGPVLHTAP